MKRFRWSSLYPRPWREEFGQEFDAVLATGTLGLRDRLDIIFQAVLIRLRCGWPDVMTILFAFGAGWLNVRATEVQWTAGLLILAGVTSRILYAKGWLARFVLLFASVPVSQLWVYQESSVHHAPLWQTVVAVIPLAFGAALGQGVRAVKQVAR